MKRHASSVMMIICAVSVYAMIIDSATVVTAAQNAVELCLKTVIPSLFPMCMLTSIITDGLAGKSSHLTSWLSKLCNIPSGSESVLISGYIGGYPLGAKLISSLYNEKILHHSQATRMLAFCSNAGPAFVFGLCSRLFTATQATTTIWSIQICSAIFVARMIPGDALCPIKMKNTQINIQNNLTTSTKAMGTICAWIILFQVITGFVDRWLMFIMPKEVSTVVKCVLELTTGITDLTTIRNEHMRYIVCTCALSFGGICVVMQTASFTGSLGIRTYLKGKITQTIISCILAMCTLKIVYASGPIRHASPLFPVILLIFTVFFQKTMAFSKTIIYNTRKTVRG